MKNTILFVFVFITFTYGFSQFEAKGTVIDSLNNTPISQVKITDTKSGIETTTDIEGNFTIQTQGFLKFEKEGYILTFYGQLYRSEEIIVFLKPELNNLDEVIINSFTIPLKKKYSSETVSVITQENINRNNTVELYPVLNKIPGVFMQNATLNTNRITIRGIGARNLFGTANIRAYFGDIPLTDGNGESAIEDFELASLSHIEIHKGPSSSSYGVGLGGTILLQPKYHFNSGIKAQLSSTFGSYGLHKILAKTAIGRKNASLNLLFSNTHSDGYRDNNEYDRNTLTLTASVKAGNRDSFSVFGSYIGLKAGIPSSLNQEDFENNPRQAAFTWGRAQGFEDLNYGILGTTWKHDYNQKLEQRTSIFGSLRTNYEPRPFNILEEKSSSFGIRSRILSADVSNNTPLRWSAGGELFFDFYNGQTFENLFEDFPVGTGSVQGDQLSNLDETRYYYNIFAEANYQLNSKLRINAGIHLNQTFFDIEDRFLSDGENSSGDFDFEPILSPKIGLNYTLNSVFILFGNISHGFSTPTTSETLLPDGIFNSDIQPEIGWNYEIGTRYSLLQSRLHGSLSLYTLRVKDLLVSRRTADDNFFAINAGKTTHNGIEAAIHYTILTFNPAQLQLFANATLYDYSFDDFIDGDNNFSGNDLTGVPSEVINLGLDVTTPKGFYGNLNFQTVGAIPANDANTVFSDRYDLLHGKIGYKNTIGDRWFYDFFFGANNILDTQYASQLQINARGFGGNAPRYFYPGLPFNSYVGININYRL